MKRSIIILSLLVSSSAFAQVPNDPNFLQKALGVLENQRNQALTNQAIAETKLLMMVDDISKSTTKIKELETKIKDLEEGKKEDQK